MDDAYFTNGFESSALGLAVLRSIRDFVLVFKHRHWTLMALISSWSIRAGVYFLRTLFFPNLSTRFGRIQCTLSSLIFSIWYSSQYTVSLLSKAQLTTIV